MALDHSGKASAEVEPALASPSAVANWLPDDEFHKQFYNHVICNDLWPYDHLLSLHSSANISEADVAACFDLVRSTSLDGYKGSSWGWSSKKKLEEMREDCMRFLIIRAAPRASGDIGTDKRTLKVLGFLSFMLTVEDDIEVVYCYEVHLLPQSRGQKIGAALMNIMEAVGTAAGMSKSMLTVFTSNVGARAFYERLGYTLYDEEVPPPKKRLRTRTTKEPKPTFMILAKDLA